MVQEDPESMKVLRITRGRVTKRALAEAAAVLRAGGVVVMPTETAYGLAAVPSDRAAVGRIYRIKGRPARKALPLIADSMASVRRAFVLDGRALSLARGYWPGPLTLVLPFRRNAGLPAAAGGTSGAVRVPRSAWARALAEAAGGLVTSTSANLSGEAAIYDARKVVASFRGRRHAPDLVLDAGALPVRMPSTIVRAKKGKIEVLREGPVKVQK